ncbi:pollen-specific leucine-rich repeat extensin-like protein 1 [Tanacetum coccineum]
MIFIIPNLSFKPNLVKRSWDSINLLLVLVALLFGFLSRNISNDEKVILDHGFDLSQRELPPGAPVMYDDNVAFGLRKQRGSSSYPDLRELSPPWNHSARDPWRFSDDTHLRYYDVMESDRSYSRKWKGLPEFQENLNFPAEKPPEMSSLPPQPPVVKKKNRVYHNVGNEDVVEKKLLPENELPEKNGGRGERKRGGGEKRRARSSEPRRILSPVIIPVAEPSLPPSDSPLNDRKRSGGNGAKDFFTSFYHKKKNKLHRGRSVDSLGLLLHHSEPPAVKFRLSASSSSPSLVSQNSFSSKKEKRKKNVSVTLAPPVQPPPPPPLPPPRPTVARVAPFVTDKPRVPMMFNGFSGIDDSSSGGDSPMKKIPPPPPLPPFKMPDWKFAVEGDFVRLQSTLSSRSASPDGDEARSPSSDVDVMTAMTPPLFSSSPDVDNEADSFIARFRAGLKLERMSKLGPGPSDS